MDKETQEAVRDLKFANLACRFLVDALYNIDWLVGGPEDVYPLFAATRSHQNLASKHSAFLTQFNERRGDESAIPKDDGPWDLWDTCNRITTASLDLGQVLDFLNPPLMEVTSIIGDIPAPTKNPSYPRTSYHDYVRYAPFELFGDLEELVFQTWYDGSTESVKNIRLKDYAPIEYYKDGILKDYNPWKYNIFSSRRLDVYLLAGVEFVDIERACCNRPHTEYQRLRVALQIEYLRARRLIETYGLRPSDEQDDILQAMADEEKRGLQGLKDERNEEKVRGTIIRLTQHYGRNPKKKQIVDATGIQHTVTWAILKKWDYPNGKSWQHQDSN